MFFYMIRYWASCAADGAGACDGKYKCLIIDGLMESSGYT